MIPVPFQRIIKTGLPIAKNCIPLVPSNLRIVFSGITSIGTRILTCVLYFIALSISKSTAPAFPIEPKHCLYEKSLVFLFLLL